MFSRLFVASGCEGRIATLKKMVGAAGAELIAGLGSTLDVSSDVAFDISLLHRLREVSRTPRSGGRAASRVRDIIPILRDELKRARESYSYTYLDVGCGDATIARAVSKFLTVPAERALACDTEFKPSEPGVSFFSNTPTSIPLKDASVDFITMFMSAHHFSDAAAMFCEARRVLKPGGRLLMREHGCNDEAAVAFYDIVHSLYSCVFRDGDPCKFLAELPSYAHYRSASEWCKLVESCGLALASSLHTVGDRFDSFYVVFTVPD